MATVDIEEPMDPEDVEAMDPLASGASEAASKPPSMRRVSTGGGSVMSTGSAEDETGTRRRRKSTRKESRVTIEVNEDSTDEEFVHVEDPVAVQDQINTVHPFGLRIFGIKEMQKSEQERLDPRRDDVHQDPQVAPVLNDYKERRRKAGNLLWAVLFGWWLSGLYYFTGGILKLTIIGAPYGEVCWNLGWYLFWPFGKYIELNTRLHRASGHGELSEALLSTLDRTSYHGGVGEVTAWNITVQSALARIVFVIIYTVLLAPFQVFVIIFTWFLVAFIPMSKINATLLKLMYRAPLHIAARSTHSVGTGEVILCTYRAAAKHYYRESIDGMNIVFVNLLPFVFFALFDGYLMPLLTGQHTGMTDPVTIFFISLISVVPLVYYCGMGVACVSAQSNFAVAAVVNATFGSLVEIILYVLALLGGKGVLVLGSIVGSLVGTNLLMPGIAMVAGGWKRKEQQFNVKSTTITTTLLIVSVIMCFTPTFYYRVFGEYQLKCSSCPAGSSSADPFTCKGCRYQQMDFSEDPFFHDVIKVIIITCAVLLPLVYAVGLLYTLKTHVGQIYEPKQKQRRHTRTGHIALDDPNGPPVPADAQDESDDEEEIGAAESHGHGHAAPQWGRLKAFAVLITSTVLFALLAELLVQSVDVVIENVGIPEKFIGFTLFAMVPSATEYVNATLFAMYNNISLSMEIANQYVVQVTLLQIPALVIFSLIYETMLTEPATYANTFPLLFPTWDVVIVLLSMIVLAYVFIGGKTDYFKGTILILMYALFLITYYFDHDSLVGEEHGSTSGSGSVHG